jgi:DNA-3-methyladenine glycosylase II
MPLSTEQILSSTDPILASIIASIPIPQIESTNNIFHDLISCIVEQQIHYRSTKRIFAKALERASIIHLTAENFYLFEQHALSQIKLSMEKLETLHAFVEYWSHSQLDFQTLSNQQIIAELSAIKGIGQWTIDMILLFTLQRPTIFPFDDFHLKQIMTQLYALNPNSKLKAQMINIAQQWHPHQSLAVLYLLAYKKGSKI